MSEEQLKELQEYNLEYLEAQVSEEMFGGDFTSAVELKQAKKEIERLNKALLDIKEILKKQSISLDWEPWSTYQVSGQKLFDITVILDKALGSDKE